jgi:low temperature requirement protein LtrA
MPAVSSVGRTHAPRVTAVMRSEERVMPLELFLDLIFVVAITQCTALMSDNPTWEGLAQGLLVLVVPTAYERVHFAELRQRLRGQLVSGAPAD